MVLTDVCANGELLPDGEWRSLTIGNITGWREILPKKTEV